MEPEYSAKIDWNADTYYIYMNAVSELRIYTRLFMYVMEIILAAGAVFCLATGSYVTGVILIALIFVAPWLQKKLIKSSAYMTVRKDPEMFDELIDCLQFYDDKVVGTSEFGGTIEYAYKDLVKIWENKSIFLLMITKNDGLPVFKEGIPHDLERFIRIKKDEYHL